MARVIRITKPQRRFAIHLLSNEKIQLQPNAHRATLSKIVRASLTESITTDTTRGDGRLMSSRASRTAAIIDAQIATVDANRSLIR